MKNIRVLSENFQFLEVKFSIYLNRHVFVMIFFFCIFTGKPTTKEINPADEGYDTNNNENTNPGGNPDGGKVSGSKVDDSKNSSTRIVISWSLVLVSLTLALL